MSYRFSTIVVTLALIVSSAGCSAGGQSPTTPPSSTSSSAPSEGSSSPTAEAAPAPIVSAVVRFGTEAFTVEADPQVLLGGSTHHELGVTLTAPAGHDLEVEFVGSGRLSKQIDGTAGFVDGEVLLVGFAEPRDGSDSALEFLSQDESGDGSAAASAQSSTTVLVRAAESTDSPIEDADDSSAAPVPTTPKQTPATLTIGRDSASSATWGEREGGKSLVVTPSVWGRTGGMTVLEFGWPSILRLAPDADSAATVGSGAEKGEGTGSKPNSAGQSAADESMMEKQFKCHVLGAPTKDTWNLEPWRDDVPLAAVLAAKCNP
ncbi:DUF2599 domain-containing protein [Timonella senegalensis]|uniref:DUF2599 domain-containing protein n=1 Tax=Timonella senegalensis TaxID=1465825 RepID=UPI002FDEAF7B